MKGWYKQEWFASEVDDHAADWIIFVKLFTAESISSMDFNLTFSFIFWLTRS